MILWGWWLFCYNLSESIWYHSLGAEMKEIYPLDKKDKHHLKTKTSQFISFCITGITGFRIFILQHFFFSWTGSLLAFETWLYTEIPPDSLNVFFYLFLVLNWDQLKIEKYWMQEVIAKEKKLSFIFLNTTPNLLSLPFTVASFYWWKNVLSQKDIIHTNHPPHD